MSDYYLLHFSEGEIHLTQVDLAKFLTELSEGYYGEEPNFLRALPTGDLAYVETPAYLLFKGEPVVVLRDVADVQALLEAVPKDG